MTKNRIYLILIAFSIILALVIRFGVIESVDRYKGYSLNYSFQKKAVDLFDYRIKDFDAFNTNQDFYKRIETEIDGSFIKPDAPVRFMELLESEAEKFDLSIRISPLDMHAEEGDLWQPIGFQIFSIGEYDNSLKYLKRIENSPWLVEILQINFERISEDDLRQRGFENARSGEVTMLVALKVYTKNDPVLKK